MEHEVNNKPKSSLDEKKSSICEDYIECMVEVAKANYC